MGRKDEFICQTNCFLKYYHGEEVKNAYLLLIKCLFYVESDALFNN